ncbi:hypothetical protein HN836_02200, partial [Candidatus Woesearchaeota archaeon]|nr:hypothetical protein [Candidatus Woesearchaeota archaeon]
SELIIFCNPKQVYSGKLEQEVARDYTKMAIEDYDKLISFDKKYMTFVETPDYETVVGQKNGRNLLLILFANQPMIRIGSINNRFKSSSYLFNPESENEEVLLPDLDIVQIDGVSQVRSAANTIKQFYDKFGWQTYIFDGKITDKQEINPTSDRYNHSIQIMNPELLRNIAKEKVDYNPKDLCF